jgi:hypothetical protein
MCDHCRRPTAEEIDAPTIDLARTRLVARGWAERAGRREGGRRWRWACPACAAKETDEPAAS